jgi:polysaccharide deactylase WbmS-like protein
MICLSFDTDRMSEVRMREFLEVAPLPGAGTFFCTQRYQCLEETAHELAPHAYLGRENNWDAELAEKREQFPNAVGWRSHSCVFSHILAEQIFGLGYRYVSVHDEAGVVGPQPVRHAWGLWHLPIYYMDNLDFSTRRFWAHGPEPFDKTLFPPSLNDDGIYVWAFHPVHIALNSPNPEEYFARRDRFEEGAPLEEVRYVGYGTADYFRELSEAIEEAGLECITMRDALERTVGADFAAATSR